MQWDHYEFKIAEHYLPALINSDTSGMTAEEEKDFNAFVADAVDNVPKDWTVGHWVDVEDSGEDWGRCEVSGLAAMRCTVKLMIYKGD